MRWHFLPYTFHSALRVESTGFSFGANFSAALISFHDSYGLEITVFLQPERQRLGGDVLLGRGFLAFELAVKGRAQQRVRNFGGQSE